MYSFKKYNYFEMLKNSGGFYIGKKKKYNKNIGAIIDFT